MSRKKKEQSVQAGEKASPFLGGTGSGQVSAEARENARRINEKGEALYLAGKPKEALTQFKLALETDPGCVDAVNNLGVYHWDTGDWDAAVRCLKQAVRLRPDDMEIITNLEKVLTLIHQETAAAQAGSRESAAGGDTSGTGREKP